MPATPEPVLSDRLLELAFNLSSALNARFRGRQLRQWSSAVRAGFLIATSRPTVYDLLR